MHILRCNVGSEKNRTCRVKSIEGHRGFIFFSLNLIKLYWLGLITALKVKACLDAIPQRQYQKKVGGIGEVTRKLMNNRRNDNNLDQEGCFAWLHHWKTAPTPTVAGLQELYQQLLRTKVH